MPESVPCLVIVGGGFGGLTAVTALKKAAARSQYQRLQVQPHQKGASLSEQELICHCQQSLADYKIPRLVGFQKTDLPKTASGTVLKRTLSEHFRSECRGFRSNWPDDPNSRRDSSRPEGSVEP